MSQENKYGPNAAALGEVFGERATSEWIPEGFQVKKVRQAEPEKRGATPKWVFGKDFASIIVGKEAVNRLFIAYRYWHCGWTIRKIRAIRPDLSETYIKQVLKRLAKMSESEISQRIPQAETIWGEDMDETIQLYQERLAAEAAAEADSVFPDQTSQNYV